MPWEHRGLGCAWSPQHPNRLQKGFLCAPPPPAQTCLCLRTPAASSQHMDAAGEATDCLRLRQAVLPRPSKQK